MTGALTLLRSLAKARLVRDAQPTPEDLAHDELLRRQGYLIFRVEGLRIIFKSLAEPADA